MRDLSGLGSALVLTLFTCVAVGCLLLVSARSMALAVASVVITGSVAVGLLRPAFAQARPAAHRVVLGVHWATDVLAGWAFGAVWALLWLLLLQLFTKRITPQLK